MCQRHIGDLSECGVRLSAAFTALSTLIRPPKSKKKKWWQVWKKGKKAKKGGGKAPAEGSGGGSANVQASPAAAAVAAAVAELDREQQRRVREKEAAAAAVDGQEAAPGMQQQFARSDSQSDDPFAGLAEELAGAVRGLATACSLHLNPAPPISAGRSLPSAWHVTLAFLPTSMPSLALCSALQAAGGGADR